jgi:hypothetical protein
VDVEDIPILAGRSTQIQLPIDSIDPPNHANRVSPSLIRSRLGFAYATRTTINNRSLTPVNWGASFLATVGILLAENEHLRLVPR